MCRVKCKRWKEDWEEEEEAKEEAAAPSRDGSWTRAGEILGSTLPTLLSFRWWHQAGPRSVCINCSWGQKGWLLSLETWATLGFSKSWKCECTFVLIQFVDLKQSLCDFSITSLYYKSRNAFNTEFLSLSPSITHKCTVVVHAFRGLVLCNTRENRWAHCPQGRAQLQGLSAGHRCFLWCGRKRHPVRPYRKER